MTEDVYERLARHLDALPNGFPRTESGIELKLLKKIFTEDEANIASQMKLTPAPADEIARRLGRDPEETAVKLEEMVKKGQISAMGPMVSRHYYAAPFVVGIYELQLKRLDKELVDMFERYYAEAFVIGMAAMDPPVMRVIPVSSEIKAELNVFPYEDVRTLIENSKAFRVIECICRKERKLAGHGCDHKVENCLSFAPIEGAFEVDYLGRPVSKEEALKILDETEEAGLVHCSMNVADETYHICNCCGCCCGILRGISQMNEPNIVARSNFCASIDSELCAACGTCAERCHVRAIDEGEDAYSVNRERCIGCGVCASTCPTGAMTLVRKPEEEWVTPPPTMQDWLIERARSRGISLEGLL